MEFDSFPLSSSPRQRTADIPHEWLYPGSLEAASKIQRLLSERVITSVDAAFPETLQTIAGVDVSNNLRDPEEWIYAALVMLDYPTLSVGEISTRQGKAQFPYVPGFLGFREAPVLVEAFQQLWQRTGKAPDLIMVDGHGISHPRGLGIASHLGVLLDLPTIGVAKSILVGKPEGVLGPQPGDHIPLIWKGRQLGAVLRTKLNVNPLYISVGHKIDLPTAIDWVMRAGRKYRLPEPTRQAHLAANVFRKSQMLVRAGGES